MAIYGSPQGLKPKTIVDLKKAGDGEEFELEIVDGIMAEFKEKTLKIKGLDSFVAPALVDSMKEFNPELDDLGYYNSQVLFKLKRKKARKILPTIKEFIESYFQDTGMGGY